MAILIGLLLFLLIFAFVVTQPDGSQDVPGKAYQEYQLYGYSWWLRKHVVNDKNWNKIKVCLADSDVCRKLPRDYLSSYQFFSTHVSPIQSGCCKPPTAWGYTYVNPTLWINPANPTADPDCHAWSNDQGHQESEERVERVQHDSCCRSGCPHLRLCRRLQCLQECTDRGALPPPEEGLDLILFVVPRHAPLLLRNGSV